MKPKKGSFISLRIQSLVYGGQGIADHEGFKIFVDDVVPGDLVKTYVQKVKSKYGEGKVEEILEPSPLRVPARCKHFETCGGCQWQFLPYEEQLKIKEQQVKDALERLGGLSQDLVLPILGDETPWHYRNKMDFSFGPGENGVMLGLYPPGYHYEVFDLQECFLQSPETPELVQKMRAFAHGHGLTFYNGQTNTGLLKNFSIREGKNTGERMVILTISHEIFPPLSAFVEAFGKDPQITSLYLLRVNQQRGKATEIKETHLAGKTVLTESLRISDEQELVFEIKPRAFFQTNTRQAEELYKIAVDFAELSGKEIVYDLYCGTGTIGLFCASKAARVIGVEANESAVENARINAEKNGISNAEFVLGSVEAVLEGMEKDSASFPKPDVVLVDPPRIGLGPVVVAKTAAFGAGKIVYVSCNPATMARDLKQFEELGYETVKVQPVDMFPQTHHVECIALLTKAS